jgi:hypothetical protein
LRSNNARFRARGESEGFIAPIGVDIAPNNRFEMACGLSSGLTHRPPVVYAMRVCRLAPQALVATPNSRDAKRVGALSRDATN